MKYIRFIRAHTIGYQRNLFYMLCGSVVFVAVVLVNPLMLQLIIDNIIDGNPITNPLMNIFVNVMGGVDFLKHNLWALGLAIVLLNVVSGIALFIRGYASGEYAERFAENVRNSLYEHLQKLPYAYHVKAKTGDLIQRCTSDVDTITSFLNNQLKEFVYAILIVIVSMSVLIGIHVKMTLLAMISFPVLLIFGFWFFKKMQAVFQSSDEAEARLSDAFQESMDAVRVVKAFNRERYEYDKFTDLNQDHSSRLRRMMELLGMYWAVSDFLILFQILVILVASIFEVRAGTMTIGNAVVFTAYVSTILWPLRNVGRILADLGKLTVAIDRLEEIYAQEPEDLDAGSTDRIDGSIVFENVSFKYDDGIENVLNNVSFMIEAGETIAIMGPTGSGKSSLVHLLTRLYDPSEGHIYYRGVDIQSMARRHVRQHVGIVLQEPYLFSKTIYENIKLAAPSADQNAVFQAASLASIHDVINEFDRGYETEVGEKGVTLSGGQKQRVAIARTVIGNYPIVVFDDSLSALDAQTDAQIRQELARSKEKATRIIITHRINSAQNADRIFVLSEGRIIQVGTHQSLMNEEGLYRKIANIQFPDTGGENHV